MPMHIAQCHTISTNSDSTPDHFKDEDDFVGLIWLAILRHKGNINDGVLVTLVYEDSKYNQAHKVVLAIAIIWQKETVLP